MPDLRLAVPKAWNRGPGDLLAVDTEGHDAAILAGVDFERFRPRLVLYEHFHLPADERVGTRERLHGDGYETMEEGFDTYCLRPAEDELTQPHVAPAATRDAGALGRRLRNLRRLMARLGLRLCDVMEPSDLDDRTVKSVLSGKVRPHSRTLYKLARGLDVPADELFGKRRKRGEEAARSADQPDGG